MKLNPYVAILLAASIGGANGLFIKGLSLPATSVAFFRTFVPTIILVGYFMFKKIKVFQGDYKVMLVGSLFNAARLFLFIVGFLYTSIGNGIIIFFSWPIFATIFGIFILKEKVSKKTFVLLSFAFLGLILMYVNKGISFGSKDFIGMSAMLLSAVLFALTMIIFKKESDKYSRKETIFYQNIVGAVVFLPFIFINMPLPSLEQYSLGLFYGFIIGIVSYLLFFFALKRMKMSHYSLLTYWEVPAALAFGVLFFGEVVTWNMILGGGMILLAGVLLRKEKRKDAVSGE